MHHGSGVYALGKVLEVLDSSIFIYGQFSSQEREVKCPVLGVDFLWGGGDDQGCLGS